MTHGKERSSLFKFLYVFFRIITFPIFAVLYVLKHPLWMTFLAVMIFGLIIYYPLQQGVELKDVVVWYKHKYTEMKLDVATAAAEKGHHVLSEDSLRALQDDVDANNGEKGENYNNRLSRDKEIDAQTSALKKRGGFKRKSVSQPEGNEDMSGLENVVAGGLESILSGQAEAMEDVKDVSGEKGDDVSVEPEVTLPQPIATPEPLKEVKDSDNDNLDDFELF